MRYICVRETYIHETLWKVGMVLPEELEPNKYFVPEGGKIEKEKKLVLVAGDDKRSTIQIIADIKDKFGVVLGEDTTRKKAFARWVKESNKKKPSKSTAKKEMPKPIGEYTPDEIEDLTREWLGKTYGVKIGGKNKAMILKEIANKEA